MSLWPIFQWDAVPTVCFFRLGKHGFLPQNMVENFVDFVFLGVKVCGMHSVIQSLNTENAEYRHQVIMSLVRLDQDLVILAHMTG